MYTVKHRINNQKDENLCSKMHKENNAKTSKKTVEKRTLFTATLRDLKKGYCFPDRDSTREIVWKKSARFGPPSL